MNHIARGSSEEPNLPQSDQPGEAVIEPPPGGSQPEEPTVRELQQRVRQQELLSELGVQALKGTPFEQLLDLTARFAAEGMGAEFAKVLEYQPNEKRLLIRAGVGWPAGIVGKASVGADLASPAGFALRTGKPVISNHLENEERFRTPELLVEHGIRRAMNVILQGDGSAYGVLEVDSRSEGEFGEQDIAFLQGAANLLGMAIERQRIESSLRAAVAQREVLLQELDHRVSNSLQIVMSLLHLQASGTTDGGVRQQLKEASDRIAAVARAHHRLRARDTGGMIELTGYLAEVCGDLQTSVGTCRFECTCPAPVLVPSDRAVAIALVLTEFVTNAAKHGYGNRDAGQITARLAPAADAAMRLSVTDEGGGLPAGFTITDSAGLGMRIIKALADRLGGQVEAASQDRGAEFSLLVPPTADPKASGPA